MTPILFFLFALSSLFSSLLSRSEEKSEEMKQRKSKIFDDNVLWS